MQNGGAAVASWPDGFKYQIPARILTFAQWEKGPPSRTKSEGAAEEPERLKGGIAEEPEATFLQEGEDPKIGLHTPDDIPIAIRHKVDRHPLIQLVLLMPPDKKVKAI